MEKELETLKKCFQYLIYKLPNCAARECKYCAADKDIINKLNNSLVSIEISIMMDKKNEQ